VVRRFAHYAARTVLGAIVTSGCWILWIALAALALLQLYVATSREMAVPGFVVHGLQSHLEHRGLRAGFDRAVFDPTGRIFVENPRLYLEGFDDPVVTARAAYVELDPWLLVVGRADAREIRIVDGTVQIPAPASPSGRVEPVARDVDGTLVPGDREISLRQVSGRVGGLLFTARG
jgi:hypothetical protein